MTNDPPTAWGDALLAADLIAYALRAPGMPPLGCSLRARAGPVRDIWLDRLRLRIAAAPWTRFPASLPPDRLIGGLDLPATLATGRPCFEPGVLARAHGGVAVLAMAERAVSTTVGILATALDDGRLHVERTGISTEAPTRFALVALDEGATPEESLPPALADRLPLKIDLSWVSWREAAAAPATAPLPGAEPAEVAPEHLLMLTEAAAFAGHGSCRSDLALVRVAAAAARLAGRDRTEFTDVATAMRLVLRPTTAPDPAEFPPEPETSDGASSSAPPPDDSDRDRADDGADPSGAGDREMAVDIADRAARLVLAHAGEGRQRRAQGQAGKSGAERKRARRGKPIGVSERPPSPDARIDAIATLRAAAPWQRLRRRSAPDRRISIASADFRYRRFRDRSEATAIFVVDASGSTAAQRLGEAKRAVELLLAQCYVRRDSVALIAFRGAGAEVALAPTRSLARAKRALAGLPGGGPTPLATGLREALVLALRERNEGRTPFILLMTDASANVALDGTTDRKRAVADAERLANRFAFLGLLACLVDIGRRRRPAAQALATAMAADYQALPTTDGRAVSDLVAAYLRDS